MLSLRLLLIVDALALLLASTISDPIVGDVAIAPVLLVGVILAIACLSGDLVPPRRRLAVACSALSIVAVFPFLLLRGSLGPRTAATVLITLQVIPLVRHGVSRSSTAQATRPVRRVIAALTIATTLLLLTVAALTWYGSAYLVRPAATTFSRGPFLTRVTTTEADFAWTLKSGADPVTLSILSPTGVAVTARDGHATGLRPDTRYTWSATVHGGARAAGTFRTAPTATSSPVTLVAVGDYGSGNDHEYAVGRLAAAVDPDLALSAGDNAYLVAAPPLLDRAIFDPLRQLLGRAPMIAALGEHDLAWNDGSAVISALHLPGHHYTAQYGAVQIVVLGLEADASALAYARTMLGTCAASCPVRFVLTHRPIAADNPIMPLLRQRHVAAIIAGHLHRYERHVRSGVLQFTVGTSGEGAGDAAYTQATADAEISLLDFGFLRINVAGGRISYQFIDERGRVLDRVSRAVR